MCSSRSAFPLRFPTPSKARTILHRSSSIRIGCRREFRLSRREERQRMSTLDVKTESQKPWLTCRRGPAWTPFRSPPPLTTKLRLRHRAKAIHAIFLICRSIPLAAPSPYVCATALVSSNGRPTPCSDRLDQGSGCNRCSQATDHNPHLTEGYTARLNCPCTLRKRPTTVHCFLQYMARILFSNAPCY